MSYDNRYSERDNDRYNQEMEIAELKREALEMQDVTIEFEASLAGESELERARRRSPITEQKCCLDPGNFARVSSLDRDPDTGSFTGDFYMCGHCGSRICEEDYAAIVAYEDAKVVALPEPPNYGAIAVELARLQARKIEQMPETRLFSRPRKGAA
jgi:hypothetical protein